MTADQYTLGFVKVEAAWTGIFRLTNGAGTSVTVTPNLLAASGRTSAVEVVLEGLRLAADGLGGTWSAFPSTDGKMNIRSTISFDLTVSDNTATRTGFSNASSVYDVTSGVHPNGVYPLAADIRSIPLSRKSVGFGSTGASVSSSIWENSDAQVAILDTWANLHSFSGSMFPEGALVTYDIWISDQILGRYRPVGSSMTPASQKPTHWNLNVNLRAAE